MPVWRRYTLGNPAAGKTTGRRSGLEAPGGEGEELGGPTGGSLNCIQGGGQAGCPRKHPRYAPHMPCLTAEGPGWGHCTAEIHRASVECGCRFSHLDLAGIPPITSSHHHHHHRHLHTCVEKTCLFAKAIMTSEQMATSPRHHPSPARAGLPQAHVPWVLDPRTAPPPLSCHWPGLALAGSHSAQLCIHPGAGEEGRSWEECSILQTLSLISPLLGSSREGQKNAQSPKPTSPGGEGERGADARSLPPQTAFLTLLPSCPALLLSSQPSSLSVGSAILSGCPHFFPSSSC